MRMNFVAIVTGMLLGCLSLAEAQPYACGSTVYYLADQSLLSNLSYTVNSAKPNSGSPAYQIGSCVDHAAGVIPYYAKLPISLVKQTSSTQTPLILIRAGEVSQQGGPKIAVTETDGDGGFIITVNNEDMTYTWTDTDTRTGNVSTDIDLESVLIHELSHALGVGSGGGAGTILQCSYHGSIHSLAPVSSNYMRNLYQSCSYMDQKSYMQVVTDLISPAGVQGEITYYLTDWPYPQNEPNPYDASIGDHRRDPQYMHPSWINWRPNSDQSLGLRNVVPKVQAADDILQGCVRLKWDRFFVPQADPVVDDRGQDHLWQPDDEMNQMVLYLDYYPKYAMAVNAPESCTGESFTGQIKVNGETRDYPYTEYSLWTPTGGATPVEIEAMPGSSDQVFIGWKDALGGFVSGDNPYTLTSADCTERTPVFKSKGNSSDTPSLTESQSATSINSQRKLDCVDYGNNVKIHHKVYTSCNVVFYTYSTDGGTTWASETAISSALDESINPSLFAQRDSVWVTWKGADELKLVKFYYLDPIGTRQFYTTSGIPTPIANCAPVVVKTDTSQYSSNVFVFYETSCFMIGYLWYRGPDVYEYDDYAQTGLNDNQEYPSVAVPAVDLIQVVWHEGTNVYFRECQIEINVNTPYLNYNTGAELIDYGGRYAVGAPSIAPSDITFMAGLGSAVTCETSSNPDGSSGSLGNGISLRIQTSNGWSNPQTFYPMEEFSRFWAPSIGIINYPPSINAYENVRIGCNYTASATSPNVKQVHLLRGDASGSQVVFVWDVLTPSSDGLHPSLVQSPNISCGMTLYSDISEPITAITNNNTGYYKTLTTEMIQSKELNIIKDSSRIVYGMGGLSVVEGTSVEMTTWQHRADTTVLMKTRSFEEEFSTLPFTCTSQTAFEYVERRERSGVNQFAGNMTLGLQVVDQQTLQTIGQVQIGLVNIIPTGKSAQHVRVNLGQFDGHRVFLRLVAANIDTAANLLSADIWTGGQRDSLTIMKTSSLRDDRLARVVEFGQDELLQNAPNPVTGVSRIDYRTPYSGTVRIAVYDLAGKEIVVLKDGYLPAGVGNVVFDAGAIPSGTYVYTLTTERGVQSRRLNVVR